MSVIRPHSYPISSGASGTPSETVVSLVSGCLASSSPAFMHGEDGNDAAITLDSALDLIATRIIPRNRWQCNALSRWAKAVTTPGSTTVGVCADDGGNPDISTILTNWGSLSTGSGAGYQRLSGATAHQFEVGKPVWVFERGAAGVSIDASIRRVNETMGSEPPIEMECSKYSTDGGVVWSQCLQDGEEAFWNIVLQSNSDHCPQLVVGAAVSDRVVIDGDAYSVPAVGIILDLSTCNAVDPLVDDAYNVYLSPDGDDITAEVSATAYDRTDAVWHMSGDVTKILQAVVAPQELRTGAVGPIDCPDMPLVRNLYNEPEKGFRKRCPYTSDTTQSCQATTFTPVGEGALTARVLLLPGDIITAAFAGASFALLNYLSVGIALDVLAIHDASPFVDLGRRGCAVEMVVMETPGVHEVFPVVYNSTTSAQTLILVETDSSYRANVSFSGKIIGDV